MEPFKNWFNVEMAQGIAENLTRVSTRFDAQVFLDDALRGLENLELKQRSEQFSLAIENAMPGDFKKNVSAMLEALHPATSAELSEMQTDETGIAGWALMPMMAYVARNGLGVPEFSLAALREMTMRSSSEFDVRPFLRDHPDLTLKTMNTWAADQNVHVRRLASEGSRPRLPWGIRLHRFIEDPRPLLPILIALRDDPSEYVRRSVANNLNDIAKDHPDLVAQIAAEWLVNATTERKRLVKHACRSLIKDGHAGALAAFGYGPPELLQSDFEIGINRVALGNTMELALTIQAGEKRQKLLVDYVLYFMRANGKLSPKVFKWTELELAPGQQVRLTKNHPYRKVTTRKDYAGKQKISVQVNGQELADLEFEFSI